MNKTSMKVVIAALLANAPIAWADQETADAAFKRGQAAVKAGRVHEACQAFEASDKLEAKVETQLSLAACYEQDGKPIAAARLYRALAETDSNAERRKTSSAKVAKLEAKAPKLRILLSQRPDGLVIKVDGVQVPNTGDVLVDVGPHEVIAIAPGFQGHASAPVDRERAIVDVILRLEAKAEPRPEPMPTPAPTPTPTSTPTPEPTPDPSLTVTPMLTATETPPIRTEPAGDHRKRNGVIIGAAGLGVIVGAVVFYGASSSKFDDEHSLCPSSQCATTADLEKAKSLVSDGRTYRGISYGMGIGGIAILGLGAYLLLAPHHEEASRVSVQIGSGSGEVTFTGHF
jgi:hypothetical protein